MPKQGTGSMDICPGYNTKTVAIPRGLQAAPEVRMEVEVDAFPSPLGRKAPEEVCFRCHDCQHESGADAVPPLKRNPGRLPPPFKALKHPWIV
jgi:hypothetical protein